MLDPNPRREFHTLSPLLDSPAVSGRVLVLGHSPYAVSVLCNNPAVGEVIYCPGSPVDMPQMAFDSDAARAKLRVTPDIGSPWSLQRRDIAVDYVDFMFVDLSSEIWERGREERMKARVREFRPRAIAYRWQEIDVAVHWIAAGCTLDEITAKAFAVYTAQTGLVLPVMTDDYARLCAARALDYAGIVR